MIATKAALERQQWRDKRQECRAAYAKGEERTLLLDLTNAWRGLTVSHRSGRHQDLQRSCPICFDSSARFAA